MKKVTHPVESLFVTRADGDQLSFLSPEQQMAPISSLMLQETLEVSRRKAPSLTLLSQYFSAPEQKVWHEPGVVTEIPAVDELLSEDSNILRQLGILAESNVQNNRLPTTKLQVSRCVSYGNGYSEGKQILINKTVGHKPLSLWNIKILWQKFLVRWF